MFAPDDCPVPPSGKVLAWSRSNFCGGVWLIVDQNRKIITQFHEVWSAARYVNKKNMEETKKL